MGGKAIMPGIVSVIKSLFSDSIKTPTARGRTVAPSFTSANPSDPSAGFRSIGESSYSHLPGYGEGGWYDVVDYGDSDPYN